MKFEPTYDSVSQHKIPQWYDDAKFGIFFHWSLFSVPAYARSGQDLNSLGMEQGLGASMENSPYAEWYLNKARIAGSDTQKHHALTYGEDYSYFNFQKAFEEDAAFANMEEWAEFCKNAGAKYVVLVTKHHDGYCLWPSRHKNPHINGYQSPVDFVGQLTDAVRSRGLKMGLYYSGIFDWTFIDYPIKDMKSWILHHLPSQEYCDYSVAQLYELIEKYQPSILWNDIGFPPQYDLNQLFADYYNAVPDGVVCDRYKQYILDKNQDRETQIENWIKDREKALATGGLVSLLSHDAHCDYNTPEYAEHLDYRTKKWELTRGIGKSFGFNQMENADDMLTCEDIVKTLVDVVSKNGNLLLNVGPLADGTIPNMQKLPLLQTGEWLKKNGESIYGTRCWKMQEGKTMSGQEVRYAVKQDTLYVSVLDSKLEAKTVIEGLDIPENSRIELLSEGKLLNWTNEEHKLSICIPEYKEQPVHVFKIYR